MSTCHIYPRSNPVQNLPSKNDLTFQATAWTCHDYRDTSDTPIKYMFIVKVYGVTPEGYSVSVNLTGFCPQFYIEIPDHHQSDTQFPSKLRQCFYSNKIYGINSMSRVQRKQFYGFQNGTLHQFLRIRFDTSFAWRRAADLIKKGVQLGNRSEYFKIYESNIDPVLRLFHKRDLSPSGWMTVPRGRYLINDDVYKTRCQIDVTSHWTYIVPCTVADINGRIAPLTIASFDLECTSSHGDFPVAKKTYKKTANELYELYKTQKDKSVIVEELIQVFFEDPAKRYTLSRVFPKHLTESKDGLCRKMCLHIDEICKILDQRMEFDEDTKKFKDRASPMRTKMDSYTRNVSDDEESDPETLSKDHTTDLICKKFETMNLPQQEGDAIIQIGTTVHIYGEKECSYKHIVTLNSCDPIDDVHVEACRTEQELLLKWRDMITALDPDVLIGFNIFGFDMPYLVDRAKELGVFQDFVRIGRIVDVESRYYEKTLSSSALGDNILKFIDMEGRVLIDIMKVVRRDHALDSYSLNNVSSHFLKMNKLDVSPTMVFRLQKGTSKDRKQIAEYCVQDCTLCNKLLIKLEIMANNIGMSNVCSVPLSYIFMRGQGIKIFSLVAKQCRSDGFLVPLLAKVESDVDDGYEGAIVLEPKEGIYLKDPVAVVDYASLYPSSMISENLSHDSIVLDPQYDNLPGVQYIDIAYDVFEGKGDKKKKVGEKVDRFMQPGDGQKGTIPRILMHLLNQRKVTRKRMLSQTIVTREKEYTGIVKSGADGDIELYNLDGSFNVSLKRCDVDEIRPTYDDFQTAVLDGLQLAFKVTANSLYGQTGAKTSQIYMKQIAACTTATGRRLILEGKKFMETRYDAEVVYGDTDSLMIVFKNYETVDGVRTRITGKRAILPSIETAIAASKEFKALLKPPHDLEYEKVMFPFILLSKKRYVANKYTTDDVHCSQSSMGIILKRRDNAPIAKTVYGGIIDILLNKQDMALSIRFLKDELSKLVDGRCDLKDLVITKALRSGYKNEKTIAHCVLSKRMMERDPGSAPQLGDRIPFVHVVVPGSDKERKKMLQGYKIEHIDYVRENNLKPDFAYYIERQILPHVVQLYALVLEELEGYKKYKRAPNYYEDLYRVVLDKKAGDHKKAKEFWNNARCKEVEKMLFEPFLTKLQNIRDGNREITDFFKVRIRGSSQETEEDLFVRKLSEAKKTTTKKSTTPAKKTAKRPTKLLPNFASVELEQQWRMMRAKNPALNMD